MESNEEQRKAAEKLINAMRKRFGSVPVVNQVMSTRPDLFLPAVSYSGALLETEGALGQKTKHLCALAAASALGGEYCIEVQMKHAIQDGADKDEILEAILIGAYMANTRSQSYALRKYAKQYGIELE